MKKSPAKVMRGSSHLQKPGVIVWTEALSVHRPVRHAEDTYRGVDRVAPVLQA
jgi:hypothetical protein